LFVVDRIMPTCLTTIARCLQSPMSVSIRAPSRICRFVDDDIFDRIATAVSYSRGNRLANDIFTNFRSEEHTYELQSRFDLVCRLLLEKKKCTSINRSYIDVSVHTS